MKNHKEIMNEKITISDSSNTHRDQLIKDMIYVCCLPDISDKNRREFVDVSIAWSFTERTKNNIEKSAKYKGCPYWSELARQRLDTDGNWKKDGEKDKGLRHEHIVPRNIFVDAVLAHFEEVRNYIKENPEKVKETLNKEFEELKKIVYKNLVGCVITKDEADKKIDVKFKDTMPNWAYKDSVIPQGAWEKFSEIICPWARYMGENGEWKTKIEKIEWEVKGKNRWAIKKEINFCPCGRSSSIIR